MKAEGRVLVHPSLEANSSKKDSASKEVNSVCLFESCGFFEELKLLKLWKRTIAFKAHAIPIRRTLAPVQSTKV